jgi:cell division protein FtsZ
VHPEANIIFGAVIDDTLGDEVRVTVIAAGFDGGDPMPKPVEVKKPTVVPAAVGVGVGAGAGGALSSSEAGEPLAEIDIEELVETANWGEATSTTADQIVSDPAFADDSDDLDIPDFLK